MSDWAGINERELQEFVIALLGGGVAAIMTWVLICVD